jgi:hypothetical protein
MSYWTVLVGGKTVYRGEEKPEERADGTLVLPKGQSFAKGKYRLTGPHDGDPPQISGKGSVPPKPGRPDKIDPAGGFGPNNTR